MDEKLKIFGLLMVIVGVLIGAFGLMNNIDWLQYFAAVFIIVGGVIINYKKILKSL